MLDILTLRIALGVVALVLLTHIYFVTYRTTRSPYSLRWSLALLFILSGSSAYLFNGTDHQLWANPLGNFLLVAGAVAVWAGARSLGERAVGPWHAIPGPLLALTAAALDSPGRHVWPGGAVFLALVALYSGLAAVEFLRLERQSWQGVRPLAGAAGLFSLFYLARCIAFMIDGPDGTVFQFVFGSEVTTVVVTAFFIFGAFSITTLSHEQVASRLRTKASRDGLTGVLNRAGFLEQAETRRSRGSGAALILADLDGYKAINDTYGHQVGDRALQAFAAACVASVRDSDLVGRYGGDEFVILLPGASFDQAERVASEISRRLRDAKPAELQLWPTVSCGVAVLNQQSFDFEHAIAAADAALYAAKSLGRDRVERAGPTPAT
ncbi:GGDEF domain-containing protein [Salinibacterium sp. GXW1014]|uniref:GGDEF domain-containing protein n=1 Tax=Salinibacterium sp. GXW1014 TaxID=3377838 RepID=UPI00383A4264